MAGKIIPTKDDSDVDDFETCYKEHLFYAFDGNETLRILDKHLKTKTSSFLLQSVIWWNICKSSNTGDIPEEFDHFTFTLPSANDVAPTKTEDYLELFFANVAPTGLLNPYPTDDGAGKEKEEEEEESGKSTKGGLNETVCKKVIWYWLSSMQRLCEKRCCDHLLGDYGNPVSMGENQKALYAFDLFAQDVKFPGELPDHLKEYSKEETFSFPLQ